LCGRLPRATRIPNHPEKRHLLYDDLSERSEFRAAGRHHLESQSAPRQPPRFNACWQIYRGMLATPTAETKRPVAHACYRALNVGCYVFTYIKAVPTAGHVLSTYVTRAGARDRHYCEWFPQATPQRSRLGSSPPRLSSACGPAILCGDGSPCSAEPATRHPTLRQRCPCRASPATGGHSQLGPVRNSRNPGKGPVRHAP